MGAAVCGRCVGPGGCSLGETLFAFAVIKQLMQLGTDLAVVAGNAGFPAVLLAVVRPDAGDGAIVCNCDALPGHRLPVRSPGCEE
ncbi:hypothetical protein ABT297_22565 [Dactylosporangium sp. NPDC000555]|uniref:hypothetical protein n=1 Tax=Dactylosporangium sp. NPDC000555 TaxID=3154260 RepID=UPI0033254A76